MTDRKKRKKKGVSPKDRRVYVIELDPAILQRPDFLKANPDRDPSKPCVYEGMTSKTPEERFKVHKSDDQKSSPKVKEFGIRLMPDLYKDLKPLTWREVEDAEKKLAKNLRKQGYAVWQK